MIALQGVQRRLLGERHGELGSDIYGCAEMVQALLGVVQAREGGGEVVDSADEVLYCCGSVALEARGFFEEGYCCCAPFAVFGFVCYIGR